MGSVSGNIPLGANVVPDDSDEENAIAVPVGGGGRVKITKKRISLAVAAVVFTVLLNVQVVEGEEANRCFAVLVFSTIMWATEVGGLTLSFLGLD